jgi:hypothetical protein
VVLTYDPETTARVAGDPELAADVSGLAIGLLRLAGSRPDAPDLAIVNVARLRDPAADDAWFRSWRDSYDEAACAQAGGIARRAETDVDGRAVFVGSCAGGPFTYHVRIGDGRLVLSLTSIGPANLGRRVVEGLGR